MPVTSARGGLDGTPSNDGLVSAQMPLPTAICFLPPIRVILLDLDQRESRIEHALKQIVFSARADSGYSCLVTQSVAQTRDRVQGSCLLADGG
jgi:hypothetical protein